ncbi:MAG: hypothetical protein JEZ07_13850 [Phycisphaerae bacterium]|nr:hypothetical protein [Phycisphaerae bacterium]
MSESVRRVKAFDFKTVLLTTAIIAITMAFCTQMGAANFFSTVMKTSYKLLMDTVFYIIALCVLAGALGGFMGEFGILSLLNWLLAPAVRLLWGMPGAATIGATTTYISDNPAILTLASDQKFIGYFKEYQKPALTNFGTSFGMGLILTAYMMTLKGGPNGDKGYFVEAIIGNFGAIIGSIVSTRMMLHFTKKYLGNQQETATDKNLFEYREIREGTLFQRAFDSVLEGGKGGLNMGMQIIPGVLVVCTFVLMITNDTTGGGNGSEYTGAAMQGIPILPWIGQHIFMPLKWMFGFQSPEAIAFPITSLGAAGAALSMVPDLLKQGYIGGNEIAVFTAMGMCWSGYLSTHVAMMDAMGYRKLTMKAISCHTIAGIVAGMVAHYSYLLYINFA